MQKQSKTFLAQKVKVQLIKVTRWLKKFCSDHKKLKQIQLERLKTMYSKAMLQTIEANLANSTQRVPGDLGISQFSVVCYLHGLRNVRLCLTLSKYCKTFDSPKYSLKSYVSDSYFKKYDKLSGHMN